MTVVVQDTVRPVSAAELAAVAPKAVTHRVKVSSRDLRALSELVRQGARGLAEVIDGEEHLNRVVVKPWGYESRIYVDDFIDVWHLAIDPGHGTSMHSHPRKITQLLCLAGEGVTKGLASSVPVAPGTVVRIEAGAFHTTQATGGAPLHVIEVETPRNKFDLVRLQDTYQRDRNAYETVTRQFGETPLRALPHLPHAYMRATSPEGAFKQSIRSGMDLFYRPCAEDLFHVPLGVAGVVTGKVEVLIAADRDPRAIATDQYYLSIARA